MGAFQFRAVIQALLLAQIPQAGAEQGVQGMSVLSQTVNWTEERLNIPCSTEDCFCSVTNKCLYAYGLLQLGSIYVTGPVLFPQEIKGRFAVAFNQNAPVEFEYFSQLYGGEREGSWTSLSVTLILSFGIFPISYFNQ